MKTRQIGLLTLGFLSFFIDAYSQSNRREPYLRTTICDSTIWMCREEPWVLIFEDEFDGDTLNTNDGDIYVGVPRDPYFEEQKAWHQKEKSQSQIQY